MRPRHRPRRRLFVAVALVACAVAATACGTANGSSGSNGKLQVVAAENFWGSLAAQLGGDRVQVTSIITNPDTDPHDYEPTAADARLIATARLVIENGIGYDPWADRLVAANAGGGPGVLTVGDLLGIAPGGNPHQWYSPTSVERVVAAISAEYGKLDPDHASYYAAQKDHLETVSLSAYHHLVDQIRSSYGGVAVGASESIFAPMAAALGLNLITPEAFLDAVSEGADPSPADKATAEEQIRTHAIRVFVDNGQNATPDVQRLLDQARTAGIPVVCVTGTLVPATASFQDWQVRELQSLASALAAAGA